MSISVRVRLLEELGHGSGLRVLADEAVRGRVVDRVERERGDRIALGVDAHVLGEVEVGEDVSVQDQEAVGEEPLVGGKADRPRGSERLGLLDVADARAAGDLVAQGGAEVLGAKAACHDDIGRRRGGRANPP